MVTATFSIKRYGVKTNANLIIKGVKTIGLTIVRKRQSGTREIMLFRKREGLGIESVDTERMMEEKSGRNKTVISQEGGVIMDCLSDNQPEECCNEYKIECITKGEIVSKVVEAMV